MTTTEPIENWTKAMYMDYIRQLESMNHNQEKKILDVKKRVSILGKRLNELKFQTEFNEVSKECFISSINWEIVKYKHDEVQGRVYYQQAGRIIGWRNEDEMNEENIRYFIIKK